MFLPTISVESAADIVKILTCSSPGPKELLVQDSGSTTQLSDVSLGVIVKVSVSSPEFKTKISYSTNPPTATLCSGLGVDK